MDSFLFGNVDEDGKIENDFLDNDLKESLEKGDNEFLSMALSGGFNLQLNTQTLNSKSDQIKPNENAIDFYSFDETILDDVDETTDSNIQPMHSPNIINAIKIQKPNIIRLKSFITNKKPKEVPKLTNNQLIQQHFPDFKPGQTLKFTQLFAPKLLLKPKRFKAPAPHKDKFYTLCKDGRDLFYLPSNFKPVSEYMYERKEKQLKEEKEWFYNKDNHTMKPPNTFELPLVLLNWEDKIIWDDSDSKDTSTLSSITNSDFNIGIKSFYKNDLINTFDWTDAIIWDNDSEIPMMKIPRALDPMLLPILQKDKMQIKVEDGVELVDRYNISNDHHYQTATGQKERIRQQYGPIRIQHSLPAIKLVYPFFKFQLTIHELRTFHRPEFKEQLYTDISFSKVKNSKLKRKDFKTKDSEELMRNVKDLTLKDTSKFLLLEYSEENPIVMNNVGMASIIYNYYRKIDDKDTYIPILEHGSPNILESIDASPFYFGNVGKGQTIQALYTNLFRAPIFKHSPPENTYLLIRHTSLRSTKYYIREIAHTYCVGQLFLTMQVPRPTSRKSINSILKSRLQVSAFRLMRQDPLQRLKLETLVKLFPDFSEQHIRQKVRDFCVYSMGCWKLKPGMSLPTEEELRKLLGPEIGCLYESMLVGEQRLKDVGLNVQDDHDEEESGRLELQTAPWTLTKNFILASQNKSMIQLHGAGDPTSIGEGFSMIKTSMKDVFLRAGETMEDRNLFGGDSKIKSSRVSLAEQQQVYKEEIDRIWNNQLRSLSDKEQRIWPELTGQELEQKAKVETQEEYKQNDQVLMIKRLIMNDEGRMVWSAEAITDQRVLEAYLEKLTFIGYNTNSNNTETPEESVERKNENRQKLREYVLQQRPAVKEEIDIKTPKPKGLILKIPAFAKSTSHTPDLNSKKQRRI